MLARAAVAGMTVVGALALMATPAHAAGDVQLLKAQYDSPGKDDRSNTSLNAEFIVLKNSGTSSVSLEGWTLHDVTGYRYDFLDIRIGAGQKLRVHTGRGTDTGHDVYWNRGAYVWNNTGDKATLVKPSGAVKDTCKWGDGDGVVSC